MILVLSWFSCNIAAVCHDGTMEAMYMENSPRDRNITSDVSRSSPKTESKRHDEISPSFKPLR